MSVLVKHLYDLQQSQEIQVLSSCAVRAAAQWQVYKAWQAFAIRFLVWMSW